MLFQKISVEERVNFSKGLALMIQGSVPIDESLQVLARQAKSKSLKRFLLEAQKRVEKGTSLTQVFADKENYFGSVFVNFVRAGEASGSLEKNLGIIADWMEKDHDLKKEISSAMLYPKIILFMTVLLGAGLTIFVLPRLLPMFKQLDIVLPPATRILMNISAFAQSHTWLIILSIPTIILVFKALNRIRLVKRLLHSFYLKIPYLGQMLKEYQLALIAHLLATLIESGITINESLKIAQQSTSNLCHRDSLGKIAQRIQKGTSLSEAINDYDYLYPSVFRNLILVGERTGSIHQSFSYLAEFYSKQVRAKAKKLPIVIEPVLLIIIGLVVLFVAVAIISPIYELTAGVGR